jgi:hypothetical protein
MGHPLRNLSIIVALVLAALVLINLAADGLQAFGTRGPHGSADFAAPTLRGPAFLIGRSFDANRAARGQ